MKTCYICQEELISKNRSSEHIILNAIGGRLKSRELLCKSCNSEIGEEADAELAKQLSHFSTLINVKRDRKDNRPIKGFEDESGQKYTMLPDGEIQISDPLVKIERLPDGKTLYDIKARSEDELDNILDGIANKNPLLDFKPLKKHSNSNNGRGYMIKPVYNETNVGGKTILKSVLKTAINFYLFRNGDRNVVEHWFPYMVNFDSRNLIEHYYPKEDFLERHENEITHIIHIRSNLKERLLYCIVEFFSTYSFLVILSQNYDGENFNETYCYDLLNLKEKEIELPHELSQKIINSNLKNRHDFGNQNQIKHQRAFEIAYGRHPSRAEGGVIKVEIEKISKV